ncbi:hypothetical protein T484DRAFT_1817252 [Baffinella frigidus]|nr:hypothetical protein T484DRAFT_1817252 [Cryptophyta sp. CCMP2293]
MDPRLLSGEVLEARVVGAFFRALDLRNACNLRDSHLIAISCRHSLQELATLDLGNCEYITDEGVASLLAACPSLTELALSGLPRLTGDPALLSPSVSSLERLSLSGSEGITDSAVSAVVKTCTRLQQLDLSRCAALSNAPFARITLANLGVLSLAYCPKLSDAAVQAVARGCTAIHDLSIAGLSRISDAALKVVAARLTGLTHLNVSFCDTISDVGIEYIATLNLSFCDNISDVGIEHLATGCELLQSLSLEQTNASDASLRALVAYSHKLQQLNLAFCHHVSESCVLQTWSACRLKSLDVSQCRGVVALSRLTGQHAVDTYN